MCGWLLRRRGWIFPLPISGGSGMGSLRRGGPFVSPRSATAQDRRGPFDFAQDRRWKKNRPSPPLTFQQRSRAAGALKSAPPRLGGKLGELLVSLGGEAGETVVDAVDFSFAGELHRRVPGGGEALAAARGAQLLGAEFMPADGAGGLLGRAGDGQRGDEGALMLLPPAVDMGAALHRREVQYVGNGGEDPVAGHAGVAALVADDGDLRDAGVGGGF